MNKTLWINNGTAYRQMAMEVMEAAEVAERIGARDARIGIKPNLVVASPAKNGATTHVEVIHGIVDYLQTHGFDNLVILEGAWVGDSTAAAFSACGYTALSRQTGVPLVDTQKDSHRSHDCKGLALSICDSAMALDFLINAPVMKGHCQTNLTCALKNMKGLIPDREKRRFHTMGLHKPIAHLNTGIRQGFVLVDAICGDLDFEEGGNPVTRNQLIGYYDPVLCDAYVCGLLGYETREVAYIGMAARLGVGCDDVSDARVVEINAPMAKAWPRASRRVQSLTRNVNAIDACSACYANLVYALERLDDAGQLDWVRETICIGQGFRGEQGSCGIGQCTNGFAAHAVGCPPKAVDILRFLREEMLS